MQNPSDIALLQRWQHQQDPLAFRALTQRYGALVFGICNRVLKNAADAEEITQDCFLKLAQDPGKVDRSVGPWLHSVAVNAAISRIRSEQRRRTREAVHESTRPQSMEYAARDLFEHVDEAISQLPDAQRYCVVGYFLEGRPRHDVAEALGVSTKTVQRKTDEAIEKIREILKQRGITTSAGTLATTMAGLKVDALPPALGVALGKIAVAGHAGAAVRAVAVQVTTGGTGMLKAAGILVAGIVLVSSAVWWNATGAKSDAGPEVLAAPAPMEASAANPEVMAQASEPIIQANATVESAAPAPIVQEPSFALARSLAEAVVPIANPTRYAALRGLVTDASERPIAGASVTLLVAGVSLDELASVQVEGFPPAATLANNTLKTRRTEDARDALFDLPDHRYTAETDELGQFLIEGIRYKGHAMIGVEAENFALTQQSLEIVENAAADVKVALTPGRVLLGKLVTPSGEPVAGARVATFSVTVRNGGAPDDAPRPDGGGGTGKKKRSGGGSSSGSGSGGGGGSGVGGVAMSGNAGVSMGGASQSPVIPAFQSKSDENGRFSLPVVYAHAVGISVASDTHGTTAFLDVPVVAEEEITLTWKNGMAALEGRLLLSSGEAASAHYLTLEGNFEASIDSENYGKASVRSSDNPPQRSWVDGSHIQLATDEEGRFRCAALAAHEFYKVGIFDRNGRKRGTAELPALAPGESVAWDFTLAPPLQVSGIVIGIPSGKPVSGARIWGLPEHASAGSPGDLEIATSDAEGRFNVDVAGEEGAYKLAASVSPWWDEKESTLFDLAYVERAEVTLEIPDPCTRPFRVVHPDGSPVAGASILLRHSGSENGVHTDTLKGVETDREGRATVANLGANIAVRATFTREGYLNANSIEHLGSIGERRAEETVTMYPVTSLNARLIDDKGMALANRDLLVQTLYGDGEELIHQVASDEAGQIVMDQRLPATTVTLEIRLIEGSSGTARLAVASFGSLPDSVRVEMLGHELRGAILAGTPHATMTEVTLIAGEGNDIGDIVLEAEPVVEDQ